SASPRPLVEARRAGVVARRGVAAAGGRRAAGGARDAGAARARAPRRRSWRRRIHAHVAASLVRSRGAHRRARQGGGALRGRARALPRDRARARRRPAAGPHHAGRGRAAPASLAPPRGAPLAQVHLHLRRMARLRAGEAGPHRRPLVLERARAAPSAAVRHPGDLAARESQTLERREARMIDRKPGRRGRIGAPITRPTSWWLETLRKRRESMYDDDDAPTAPVEFASDEERRACIRFFNAALRAEESG